MFPKMKLERSFYLRPDTLEVATDLIGKHLVHEVDGIRLSGKIVETEAYLGEEDMACHAFGGKRTKRTETMYAIGGTAYVYLCYGVHDMLNIVTSGAENPQVVLIRAIEPVEGIESMLLNRRMTQLKRQLTAGPGALCKAMGITRIHDGLDLCGKQIWLEDRAERIESQSIIASPRVGVAYAKEHASLPYRFRLKDNPWTSPAK